MHRLTSGRFSLGLGRGIARVFDALGLPRITTAQMEDFVDLMRRMWRGEVIVGHDGPAGRFPLLRLGAEAHDEIPMTLTAFGPNSLALGGRAFDAVVLHTFFTDETLARCVQTVKRAAEEAGRDRQPGHHRGTRTDRGPDPGGVAGAGRHRFARAMRREGPRPVRPRRRRRHPARRQPGGNPADRRVLQGEPRRCPLRPPDA